MKNIALAILAVFIGIPLFYFVFIGLIWWASFSYGLVATFFANL